MEYRNARPDERDDFMDLARLSFGFDLEQLIPKVYDVEQDPSAYHKVAVERGRILSQVAVLPETLKVVEQTLKVGFLGIVSTHPRARGQGHMSTLMDLWLEEGRHRFDLLVLYGQRQRYEHFGFTQGGIRLRHLVESANVRQADAKGVSFIAFPDSSDARRLAFTLNEERLASVARPREHSSKILRGFGQKAWAVSVQGRLAGYLTANAEGNEITEIALADNSELARVLKGYLEFSQKPSVSLLTPEYEVKLNEALWEFAETTRTEAADMYYLVDFAKVLQAYLCLKWATSGLNSGVFSAVLAGQPVTVKVDDSGVSVLRSAPPEAVVLDRSQAQTLLLSNYGKRVKVAVPEGWFPLPIFWYYADRF